MMHNDKMSSHEFIQNENESTAFTQRQNVTRAREM